MQCRGTCTVFCCIKEESVLCALSDRVYACDRDSFDAVYGSSAGAINATYFLSGQRDGVKIYTEEIANKDFIDLSRLINISRKAQGEQPEVQQTRYHSKARCLALALWLCCSNPAGGNSHDPVAELADKHHSHWPRALVSKSAGGLNLQA